MAESISLNELDDELNPVTLKNLTEEDSEKKPDGGWGWVILVCAFLISFILDGIMYSFGIIF